jgi:hypothetical protein
MADKKSPQFSVLSQSFAFQFLANSSTLKNVIQYLAKPCSGYPVRLFHLHFNSDAPLKIPVISIMLYNQISAVISLVAKMKNFIF